MYLAKQTFKHLSQSETHVFIHEQSNPNNSSCNYTAVLTWHTMYPVEFSGLDPDKLSLYLNASTWTCISYVANASPNECGRGARTDDRILGTLVLPVLLPSQPWCFRLPAQFFFPSLLLSCSLPWLTGVGGHWWLAECRTRHSPFVSCFKSLRSCFKVKPSH